MRLSVLFITGVCLELSSCECGILFVFEFGHDDFKNMLDFTKYLFCVKTMALVHILDECKTGALEIHAFVGCSEVPLERVNKERAVHSKKKKFP